MRSLLPSVHARSLSPPHWNRDEATHDRCGIERESEVASISGFAMFQWPGGSEEILDVVVPVSRHVGRTPTRRVICRYEQQRRQHKPLSVWHESWTLKLDTDRSRLVGRTPTRCVIHIYFVVRAPARAYPQWERGAYFPWSPWTR